MMRRCIESVIGQSYRNIEFVIQDGASTDGTLQILREYADRDGRIKLVSEPDSGPAEAFWKVLQRCQGAIIGTCLSDEELLSDAVAYVVEQFRREPQLGALTCDGYISDEKGQISGDFRAGEFDFVSYLFDRYCPFWPGSFFRRKALIDVGLMDSGWNRDCIEFEIWCRLATDHEVKHDPHQLSMYAIHPGQASNTPANLIEHIDGRLNLIAKLFSEEGFFGSDEFMKLKCMINQLRLFYNHARAYRLDEVEERLAAQIRALEEKLARVDTLVLLRHLQDVSEIDTKVMEVTLKIVRAVQRSIPGVLRKLIPNRIKLYFLEQIERTVAVLISGHLPVSTLKNAESQFQNRWARASVKVPSGIRQLLPLRLKTTLRNELLRIHLALRCIPAYLLWPIWRLRRKGKSNSETIVVPESSHSLPVYPRAALLYDARGQIRQALEMWRRAEPLGDATIDSLACQATLKLPGATYSSIAALQRRWADRYAQPTQSLAGYRFEAYDGRRKLRIGYHCSFMESDTIRFIMRNVIAAHDRSSFEIHGYAPGAISKDIRSAFDYVHDTTSVGTEAFVEAVRRDQIDVFVELTGFSPGHRYIEMASRCAPVQVSYLNHHGTSCIAAVDYFLSDGLSTPAGSEADATFTEQIYRLPGALLCYDYEGYPHPPVANPPHRANGRITFGCFGTGSKINSDLIAMWAEMLHRVPGSIFYIRNPQLTPPDNLRYLKSRFGWFGIGPERLRIAGGIDRQSLLKCYEEVDISLDTWPYCGGNTVGESLWQGVPVVTLKGDRISSRYGAALVVAAGCPDLVAASSEEYIDIAVKLASDPDRLLFLRRNLRSMCKVHGLGDSTRYARDLEQFYRFAMERRAADQVKTDGAVRTIMSA